MQRFLIYLFLQTLSAHHQEYINVHTASGIVNEILLLAAIMDEMELRSISSMIAASSSI